MKVTLEQYYRDVYTVAELEQAKAVIKAEKDDTMTPTQYAQQAVREWLRVNARREWFNVVFAEATTKKAPCIEYDRICDGSGFIDVEIHAVAVASLHSVIEIWANLSDIWSIDGELSIGATFFVCEYKNERK